MENAKLNSKDFYRLYLSISVLRSLLPFGSKVKVKSLKFQGICWNGWDSRIAFLSGLRLGVGGWFPCHIARKGAESWEGFVLVNCYRIAFSSAPPASDGLPAEFFPSELECVAYPERAELRPAKGDWKIQCVRCLTSDTLVKVKETREVH